MFGLGWEWIHQAGGERVLKHRNSPTEIPMLRINNLSDLRAELGRAGTSNLLTKDAHRTRPSPDGACREAHG